ncbi:hypothetical protein Tco_1329435 [Tanacetum coccineum]
MNELMLLCMSLVQLKLRRHHNSRTRLVHVVGVEWKQIGASGCTVIEITSDDEDSSEIVQRIENEAKNGDFRLRFEDVYAFFEIKTKSLIFPEHSIRKSTEIREALTWALIVKQGTHPSLIRVPVTIKILVITNLYFIHQVLHNSLTVVRSVEVPIVALIVKPGTCLENNRIFVELLRTLKTNSLVGEPEGSNDFTEVPFDDEQILRQHNTAYVTPPPLAYTPSPPVLATMEPLDTFLMGDEVISTIPERENDEFIKSSVDDLVPVLRESEFTLDTTDLECSMLIDPPLPCTDVLGDTIVDIDLLLGEHLDTLSTRDRKINFNPIRDIEELELLLVDDPVPVPRVFDEPLGHSDSISRSFNVAFSNPLFDFNDDFTLCNDNALFDEEFEDIRGTTRVMETPSFGFHHMSSPRPAAYSPKEVMYRYYHPHLTSGDGFDPEIKKIPSDESKIHIEVLLVLWGNKLPIPDCSLLLSR